MRVIRSIAACAAGAGLAWFAGCTSILPPPNADAPPPAPRTFLQQLDGAALYTEEGLEDGWWLEVEHSSGPGVIGGYLSSNSGHRGAILVMLPGATGMNPAGILEKARNYHDMPAGFYREAGYMTLVLAPRECGSAYGQDDLADVIDVVDWLNRAGKATLGVERIYVWGYSTGGMLAMLLNRHRPVQAMVSLAGLSSPAQFGAFPFFYGALSGMFSRNAAFCQLGATMGTLGGAEWNVLDNVAHLEEFTSPMLFVHGTGDLIITTANTWAVADRYGQLLASGTALPLMEFMYPPLLDHFTIIRRPDVIARVIEFFEQFEPARP